MHGEFPQVWRRDQQSRVTLELLRFRHNLVRQRTSLANQLQALARKRGLPRFTVSTKKGRKLLLAAELPEPDAYLRENLCRLYDTATAQIGEVDGRLRELADRDEAAKLLMTHSGIGVKTALAVAATLGPPQRFGNMRQVTAFVGLDPLNKS